MTIPGYRVTSLLSAGATSTVHSAKQDGTGLDVVVKRMPIPERNREEIEKRINREVETMARLGRHGQPFLPEIVEFRTETEETGPVAYIVMTWIEGQTLRKYLDSEQNGGPPKKMDETETLALLRDIGNALSYLHKREIVHRDVKPANIIRRVDGTYVLVDLGVAREILRDDTSGEAQPATIVGTPSYMAPELRRGIANERSDLFSLGVVLYECLAGELPWGGNAYDAAERQGRGEEAYLPPFIGPPLRAPVRQMLLLDPMQRYSTARGLLDNVFGDETTIDIESSFENRCAYMFEKGDAEGCRLVAAEGLEKFPSNPRLRRWGGMIGGTSAVTAVSPSPKPQEHIILETIVNPVLYGPIDVTHTVPKGFSVVDENGVRLNSFGDSKFEGPCRIKNDRTDYELVLIPSGDFLLGSDENDVNAREDEKPQRQIHLDAYWIGVTEVTNAHYRKINPSHNSGEKLNSHNQPVVNITRLEAEQFCRWAGMRLPTEAEWEKAARGADGRIFPWGNKWSSHHSLANVIDPDRSEARSTTPVGNFPEGKSPFGLVDVAGNVEEWCKDWYDQHAYERIPSRNPQGPPMGARSNLESLRLELTGIETFLKTRTNNSSRGSISRGSISSGSRAIVKGGSFISDLPSIRSASRNAIAPYIKISVLGFRCAVSPVASMESLQPSILESITMRTLFCATIISFLVGLIGAYLYVQGMVDLNYESEVRATLHWFYLLSYFYLLHIIYSWKRISRPIHRAVSNLALVAVPHLLNQLLLNNVFYNYGYDHLYDYGYYRSKVDQYSEMYLAWAVIIVIVRLLSSSISAGIPDKWNVILRFRQYRYERGRDR